MLMNPTVDEVLQFVAENDVKFIRLAFCDLFGVQKNISIMPDQLRRAFETGISFDASAVRGFLNVEESDLFLVPDPGTLAVLPWRPSTGRVVRLFCHIRHPDGRPFAADGRKILSEAAGEAARLGYQCHIGAECEFYLFQLDEYGNPTDIPHDNASYCDIAPLDRGENVRREICLTLEEMGIVPESSHHEQGPGQNEIVFRHADAFEAADHLVTFRSVVETVAARNGLFASFHPKPLANRSGNGLHVNLSLFRNGENIFRTDGTHSPEAESFVQGVLRRVREITAFLNPLPASYQRFGEFEAPRYVTWSRQNRSQLVRIPAAVGEQARMELRSPDPMCNPYYAFALLLRAGLEGVREKLELTPPADRNLYLEPPEGGEQLPVSLAEAVELAKRSEFIARALPAEVAGCYLDAKRREA